MPNEMNNIDNVLSQKKFTLPGGASATATLTFNAAAFLNSFDDSIVLDRYSPVLQRRLGDYEHNNISITGKFRTNYEYTEQSKYGGYSFIQVRKNSTGTASAYSGYGIAWRPSIPDRDVSIPIIDVMESESGSSYYDITFDPTYNLIPENNLMFITYVMDDKLTSLPFNYAGKNANVLTGCYIPGMTPNNTHHLEYMPPNIYIVDNDPAHGDTYAARYVIDPLTGLSFVQAATTELLANTVYYFKILITGDNALTFYLTEDEGNYGNPIISCGAITPLSSYLDTENVDSFGISVYDTCGYQWWYDDLRISKLSGEYAAAFFNLDVNDMPNDLQIEMNAYGESATPGITASVWNINTGKWDRVLSAPADGGEYNVLVSNIFNKEAYATANHIMVMLTTHAASTEAVPSALYIDYLKVVRANVLGMHIGHCIDIYVDDPGATLRGSTQETADADAGYVDLSEYVNVSALYDTEGNELTYGIDYIILQGDPNTYNSRDTKAMAKLSPAYYGQAVIVKHWPTSVVSSLQGIVDSDAHHPLGTSVIVKHKGIHEISLPTGSEAILEYLPDYLSGLQYSNDQKTLSYSELSKYIYGISGRHIDYALVIRHYDGKKKRISTLSSMGSEYAIGTTETFRVISAE